MTDRVQPEDLVPGTVYIVRDKYRDDPRNRLYIQNGRQAFHPNGQPVLLAPDNTPVSLDYKGSFKKQDNRGGLAFSVFHGDDGDLDYLNNAYTFHSLPPPNALNTPRKLANEFSFSAGKRIKRRKTRKSKKYR
jgi:hypothetical protein